MYYNNKKLQEITIDFTYDELRHIKSPLLKELNERFADLHKACKEVLDLNVELNQARDAARLGSPDRLKRYSIIRARLTLKCWTELHLKVQDQPLYETLQKLKAHSKRLAETTIYPDSPIVKQNVLCALWLCQFARELCSESMDNTEKLYPRGDKLIDDEFRGCTATIADYDEEKVAIRSRLEKESQILF